MTRIYIANLPPGTTSSELRILISKLCPVVNVYKPGDTATGIDRSFAIISVDATQEQINRCMAAYNNSSWKGSKLRLELAKDEFYQDRLKRERRERDEADEAQRQSLVLAQEKYFNEGENPVVWKNDVVRLKVDTTGIPLIISTVPVPCIDLEKASKKSKIRKSKAEDVVVHCGRKWIFSYDESDELIVNDAAATSIHAHNQQHTNDRGEIELTDEREDTSKAKVVEAAKSDEKKAEKPQGGGLRKGFGTVANTSAVIKGAIAGGDRVGREDAQCCVEDKDGEGDGVGEKLMEKLVKEKKRRNEYDMEVDELEAAEFGDYDGMSDSDSDVPCVLSSELTDESLQKERQRSLHLFQDLLKSNNPHHTTTGDTAATTQDSATVTLPTDNLDSAEHPSSLVKQKLPGLKRGWESVNISRFDPTKKNSSSLLLSKEEEEERNRAAAIKDELELQNKREVSGGEIAVEAELSTDDFADLGTLKDIFYKGGGVFWGDDVATINEAVSKGNMAEDAIFREAEKLGFDIRGGDRGSSSSTATASATATATSSVHDAAVGVTGSTATAATAAASGGSFSFGFGFGVGPQDRNTNSAATAAASSSTANEMKFGFFDEPDLATAVTTAKDISSTSDVDNENRSILERHGAAADSAEVTDATSANKSEAPVTIMPLSDVVANAKLFARERSVQDITADWRERREKLAVDYKRKRKDAKRRVVDMAAKGYYTSQDRPGKGDSFMSPSKAFTSSAASDNASVRAASEYGRTGTGAGAGAGSWKSAQSSKRARGGKGVRGKSKKPRTE